MNKQRPSTALLIALTYLVRVATCSDQHTETDLGTYINRLKAYTKVCEDQKSSLSTEQFTALSVTKEWITIQETLEIYQSLFKVPDQDDKITVLTIRNNHLAETDGIEECIGHIVTAAQNYIYENRSETALDDMCVTIECIDRENIQDCDALNKNLGKIEKAKNDVAAYFLHNISDIIYGTLTQLISNQIDHSLSRYFYFGFDDEKYVSEDGKIDFEATRRDFLKFVKKKIPELVENFSSLDLSSLVSKKQVQSKYSIFSFILSYIVKYEDENNISYFNDDAKLIKEFIRHIIDEHEYLLEGAINFFVNIFSNSIEQIENENTLNEILEYTHKEMVRVSDSDKNYDRDELGEHLGNICIQLKEDSKFVSLRKAFFEKISLDSQQIAKMVETFHTEKNDLFKCLHADNVAQIIFRGKLDEIKLWRICNVMRSTCMIKNLIGHQSIHIDFGREMNEEELKTSFVKYKTRCKDLASEIAITDANFEEIHVYTTAKPKHEEMANNALMLQTYKTDTKIVKEQEACTINTLSVSIANTTQVTVETYEDQKSCFELLSCISSDVSEITSLHVINIVNELETIVIYVTQNVTNSLSTEQISVFYDMSKSKKEKENQTTSSGSSIKSVTHAPTNIIKDLIHYIQLLQLTLGKEFVVPNIVSVSKFDVLFTDQIYNKPSTSMTNFTSDYLKQFRSCGSRNDYRKYVAKCHIMNFLGLGGESIDSGMREPAQVLGIDTIDFYKVLYEFLMRRHIRTDATKFKHDFYLCSKKNNIVLLTTRHDDGFKVLKICEQNESKYSNSLVIQSSNTFSNILNDQKNRQLLKCFDYIARTLGHKMSFAARVIIEVCKAKSISDTCSGIVDRSKVVTKYVDMFLDMIKALPYQNSDAEFAVEPSTTNENDPLCPSDLYPSFLQQHLTINNVKMIITRIVDYIYRYTSTREINITSIILSKKTKISAGRRDASMLRGTNDKLVWNAKHLHDDE